MNKFFLFIFLFILGIFLPISLINAQVIVKSNSISMSAIVPSDSPAVNLISSSSGSYLNKGGILIFRGYAYPNALISLKRDGQIITSVFADSNAFFEISLTQMNLGKSDFILGAQEVFSGNFSIFYKFNLKIDPNSNIVIDGIVFPSTLKISKSKFISGESIKFSGFSVPNSEINLKIDPILKDYFVLTDNLGKWDFVYYSDIAFPQIYEVKVKTLFNTLISEYSTPLFFEIKKEKGDLTSTDIDKNIKEEEMTIIEIPLYPEKPIFSEEEPIKSSEFLLKIVYSIWLYIILLLIPLLIFWLRRHKR